jgi:hypothetical protein
VSDINRRRWNELKSSRASESPLRCSSAPANLASRHVRYSLLHDSSEQRTPRTQSALSLRFRPQIQVLLSREGRSGGSGGTGQSGRRSGRTTRRSGAGNARTSTEVADAPALEGDDFPWLRAAHENAAQSGWQLTEPGLGPLGDAAIMLPRGCPAVLKMRGQVTEGFRRPRVAKLSRPIGCRSRPPSGRCQRVTPG